MDGGVLAVGEALTRGGSRAGLDARGVAWAEQYSAPKTNEQKMN
jgi:hypothetical protein